MFSMPILDVAIGLCFLFLLLGLICSTVNEMIAGWLKTRATFLERGVSRLLGNDAAIKAEILKHPMIASLGKDDGSGLPSYIPAARFATALLDVVSGKGSALTDVAAVRAGVEAKLNPELRTALTALLDASRDDAALLRKNMEQWFDDGMSRVSGWYKRNAQRNLLFLSIGVTLVMNADTLAVARTLWTNQALRAAVVAEAQVRAAKKPPEEALPMVEYPDPNDATASEPRNLPSSPTEALSTEEQRLLGELTGWNSDWAKLSAAWKAGNWFSTGLLIFLGHLAGWIITAVAVSLGAPFWFDTLNKFMNVRAGGRPPAGSDTAAKPATT
jgi:hypothetical protein